jgi:hypothetical protein
MKGAWDFSCGHRFVSTPFGRNILRERGGVIRYAPVHHVSLPNRLPLFAKNGSRHPPFSLAFLPDRSSFAARLPFLAESGNRFEPTAASFFNDPLVSPVHGAFSASTRPSGRGSNDPA